MCITFLKRLFIFSCMEQFKIFKCRIDSQNRTIYRFGFIQMDVFSIKKSDKAHQLL